MAIQAPGMSKYCEQCGREYLNDERIFPISVMKAKVEVSEGSSGIMKDPPVLGTREPTLARQVFKNFDKCIFCGGKFIS